MTNQTQPKDVLTFMPNDLPIPIDDGLCKHLENNLLPDISLHSTNNTEIHLSKLQGWNVIFCYPMTGRPGFSIPDCYQRCKNDPLTTE
jgi:hypothetical protein